MQAPCTVFFFNLWKLVHDGVMDAGTRVRVQFIFFEVSVVFSYMVTHYASGSVADLLVLSSSLPSMTCARGTVSTSRVLPFFVVWLVL